MLTKNIWVAVFLLGAATFFSSCSETKEEVSSVKEAAKPLVKKQNGVLYKPSPLALEMRRMYENMKLVNSQLKANDAVPSNLLEGYEAILTAEATNPADLNAEFYGFAKGWLTEVAVLKGDLNRDNYNNVMNACVNCHESFCPGPIPKIKKLRLVP